MTELASVVRCLAAGLLLALGAAHAGAQSADYIVAVVNQELVTAAEVKLRIERIREEAAKTGAALPPPADLRKEVLDTLIDERVLVTAARDSGARVDPVELDRAVASVAAQNQLTIPELRERLGREGVAFAKFRDNIKDQIMVSRVRERDVTDRIKVSDDEIDAFVQQRAAQAGSAAQLDIAQILVAVPEAAGEGVVAERRQRALAAQQRVRAGEDFAAVAREVSDDSNRAQGGDMGMRPVDRLPDLFVKTVEPLQAGQVAPELLRSGAGFHVLKLVGREAAGGAAVQQVRARHILLRPSEELPIDAAAQRLLQFKREIESGGKTFEQLARANSVDASAVQGGDLGWVSAGQFVPEFETALKALPIGGISNPVVTRFGVHLIQALDRRSVELDRKQQRDQARNILREQKFQTAYNDWLRDLRGRAYIEMREPPP